MDFEELLKIADRETKSEKQWNEFVYKKICTFRQESMIAVKKKNLKEYLDLTIKGSAKIEISSEFLINPMKHEGFLRVAKKGFHEFNTKIPNASNDGKSLFRTIKKEYSYQPFVTSRTVNTTKKYGSVDNAALSFAQKILSHQFILDGEFKCIGIELTTDSLVRKTLIKMGLPEKITKKIGMVIQDNIESPNKDDIHRFSKQIFFPCDNGQYIVVTPVQHTGLSEEFHRRITRIMVDPNKFIAFRNTFVAGANPINAGLLNSELGGRHKHLLAIPPKKNNKMGILKRILLFLPKNKTLFPSDRTEIIDFELFKKIERSKSNNRMIRAKRTREVQKIINLIIFDSCFLAKNLFSLEHSEIIFDSIPDVEHKLIDAKYRDGKNMSPQDIKFLVDINMKNIKLHHEKMLNETVEKEFRDIFQTVFRKGL